MTMGNTIGIYIFESSFFKMNLENEHISGLSFISLFKNSNLTSILLVHTLLLLFVTSKSMADWRVLGKRNLF